ncbi:MAG: penicillin acylase family protein [Chlorobi bacterium]|nr:penicillin acylase family protein [Chlorobiota bacterium]
MKLIVKILLGIFTLLLLVFVAAYSWIKGTAPTYEGQKTFKSLSQAVEIYYDDFGVPHIYAENAEDGYFALGYAHAQERLFQMVMIRRATSGRLSEILGKDLIKTDEVMLSLGIGQAAEKSSDLAFEDSQKTINKQAQAYLDGINAFIDEDNLPIEFKLIGFKPEHFKPVDIYKAIGYMSLSFTSALSLEPMMSNIYNTLGEEYLVDFLQDSASNSNLYDNEDSEIMSSIIKPLDLQEILPIPIWEGSNNWVMGKDRSESRKVLLANDTHIKYSQPAVWFEANLNYPGFEMSGYYLAGVPFAIIGHNSNLGWGITIFPFDNMDLYRERTNPENPDQYWHNGRWHDFAVKSFDIKVKGAEDVDFKIRYSIHGPEMNPVYESMSTLESNPVCLWWSLHDIKTTSLEALYEINKAKDFDEFQQAMHLIDIVGLNVVYGDTDDNIALWASGKIPIRDASVNSKLILDGADSTKDFKAYYSFDKNPAIINPEDGFICTSNDAPIRVDGIEYPGYYYPGYRANRIKQLANSRNKWSLESMKTIQNDVKSERDLKLRNLILKVSNTKLLSSEGATYAKAINYFYEWNGEYQVNSVGASIFTSSIYNILKLAMLDELGEKQFADVMNSMPVRSSIERLFLNRNSPWWDNINTKDIVETRNEILAAGFKNALFELQKYLGDDFNSWQWGKLHTLTHVHPIGRKEPFDMIFNVGPFADRGGNEVVLKEAFKYNGHGPYKVFSGPAMRMLVDFANPATSFSILPTGQSGNFVSPHYKDQARMFINGKYRTLELDKEKVKSGSLLELIP